MTAALADPVWITGRPDDPAGRPRRRRAATTVNGTTVNGTTVNGTTVNGTTVNGTTVTAATVNGTAGTAAVTVTVQIALGNGPLPPAAAALVESLRALAGPHAEPVADQQPEPPAVVVRPQLVRAQAEPALRVHLASRTVLRDGTPARLTRREYDLLAFLCAHPRRVFSRTQLLQQVWGYQMVSGERTVDVHVRRLRVKLGSVVATVRGVGYRLEDDIDVHLVPEAV